MIHYSYDQETGIYSGVGSSQKDPRNPGQYLCPAYATTIAPPAVGQNKVAQWNGSSWDEVDDPAWVKAQEKADLETKWVIFYHDVNGEEPIVLDYMHRHTAYLAENDEPSWGNELISLVSDVNYIEVDGEPSTAMDENAYGVQLRKVDGGALADRDQADVDAETTPIAWDVLRGQRDALIHEVEWMKSRHQDEQDLSLTTSIDGAQYTELITYIQALRDVPANTIDPTSPTWPTKPAWI